MLTIRLFPMFVAALCLSTNTLAYVPGGEDCTRVAVLGEFSQKTSQTTQLFGWEVEQGAVIGLQTIDRKNLKICPNLHIIDINNSLKSIPEVIRSTVSQEGIWLFLGLGSSDQAVAAQEALKTNSSVLFSPSASNEKLNQKDGRTVLLFPGNSKLAEALVRETIKESKKARLSIILSPTSTYSSNLAIHFEEAARKQGVSVVQKLEISTTGQLDRELAGLQKNSTHIFMPLFELDAARVATYLKNLKLNATLIGSDAWGLRSEIIKKLVESAKLKVAIPVVYPPKKRWSKTNTSLTEPYVRRNNRPPGSLAAFSFDGIRLMNSMIEKCGLSKLRESPEKCLDQVLPFETTTGSVTKRNGLGLLRSIDVRDFSEIYP